MARFKSPDSRKNWADSNIGTKMFFNHENDGFFYTGHASILVRLSGKRILFDPVVKSKPYGNKWVFFPENQFSEAVSGIDAVFVSHIHQDHYDVNFLKSISTNIPIFILDGRPQFEASLVSNNIKHRVIKSFEIVEVFEGVFVYGILNRQNGVDSSCIIFNSETKFYHGNDNYCSLTDLRDARELVGSVDFGFIPFAYINWYPGLIGSLSCSEKRAESRRLVQAHCDIAIAQAEILGVKKMVPFGANLFQKVDAFSDSAREILCPAEFVSYCRNRTTRPEFDLAELYAGDWAIRTSAGFVINRCLNFRDGDEFRFKLNQYLTSFDDADLDQEPQSSDDPSISITTADVQIELLSDRWERICDSATESFIFRRDLLESDGVVAVIFEANRPSVRVVTAKDKSFLENIDRYHMLIVPPAMLRKYVSGKVSAENIIGSRRFLMVREPEGYRPESLKIISTTL